MILASARSLRARFAEAPELIRRELLGKLAVWAIKRELALHVERANASVLLRNFRCEYGSDRFLFLITNDGQV